MNSKSVEKIIIFDTTLRDGEQCPGASLNLREKLEVAHQLAALNVDVIEGGFPIASPDDFEAVKAISLEVKGPRIAGLARCVDKDIEKVAQALEKASLSRIHVFLATSKIHMQYKLKKAEDEILKMAVEGVKKARKYVEDVEFSPEDASRTEPAFLAKVVEAVIEAGAKTVNIPDTVGYAFPEDFGKLIYYLRQNVRNMAQAVISVHCHNDLGLAVANSLMAIRNGARQIECTINGIGERAGNASLEEIVMTLKTRRDIFKDVETHVRTKEIIKTSRLVSNLTGMVVQPNKAIVGENAFAHESGIHQDGVLKERTTYEIMSPEDVGLSASNLVLGKHSGRHAFRERLKLLGFSLNQEEIDKLFEKFKVLADKKKTVYDEDLVALVEDELAQVPEIFQLEYLHIASGNTTVPTATVRLRKDQEVFEDAACGDGPVDASYNTIDRLTGIKGKLLDYSLRSITSGKDALGEVVVKVQIDSRTVTGKGTSTDILEASARAYLNAINRILFIKEKKDVKGV
ncbi:MAG: 2-isopropylmalate synthase [Chlamydiae bacterium]|nr:2-isopropylmalate synthase [Chlamydiota bacterium]MBI3277281.1 2-isopropylmalate synthase [Chlamydiota bacterium]